MTIFRKVALAACAFALMLPAAAQQRPTVSPGGDYPIAGMVVDVLSMQPIAGASVLIASVDNREATLTVRTGPDGRFAFAGLARGKYSLNANHRGYPPQGYEQHDNYSTAIAVGPDLDSTRIVFRLQPGATIRGRVVDEENDPVDQATVRLFMTHVANGRLMTQMVGGGSTNDQGTYAFSHLREGTYYVAASGQPWYANLASSGRGQRIRSEFFGGRSKDPADDRAEEAAEKDGRALDKAYPLTFFGDATDSANASPVRVQPGETVAADITLRAVTAARLRIPVPEEALAPEPDGPIAGGRVRGRTINFPHLQLFQRVFDGTLINVNSMAAGGYNAFEYWGFAPGHYLIQSSTRTPGPPSRDTNPSGSYLEVDISGDMELPTGASPTATLDGVAQFEGSAPPSSLVVMANNQELSRTHVMRLNNGGEFHSKDLLIPGTYEVSVTNAEGWYIQSVTAAGAKLSGRTLRINGGESVRLTLKIAQGLAEVNGTALRDGKPQSGAMIVLVPRNAETSAVLFRRDQSDSDGTFTLRGVVPGTYTLIAIEDGWKLAWSESSILRRFLPKGETLQVTPSAKIQSSVTVQAR